MWVEDEYVYLTAYSGIDPIDGAVYCLKTDGSLVWKYVFTGIPDHILAFGADTADKLAFENYSRLCVINKEDGSFLCETDCGREIVTYAAYENSDTLTYMSREGEYHYYMTDSNEDMVIMDKFITNSDNLKDFDYGNGYYTSAAYSDNAVAVYENIMGKEAALQVDIDKTPLEMEFSKDEKYLVCSISETDYRTLLVVDMEKKEVAREIVTDSLIRDFAVTQKDEIMVLHTDSIESYDLINGERIFKRETPTSNRYFLRNGEAYAGEQLLAFHMCDTRTGDALYIMEDRHILQDGMLVSDIDSSGEWYAYAGEEEKGLVLGTFENGNIRTIDVNINAVNDIALAKQEQVIYVTYLDETVEVYNSNTGEFLRSYDNLSGGIKEVIELPEMELTLLLTTTDAYLLNEDKEVIAFIEGFECYKSTTDSFILSNYGRLYEVSRYGLEELIGAVH